MNILKKNVILEDVSCPLGCQKNDEVVLTGHDRLHDLPGEFTVVKCRTCGLMRTNPRPTPDTIGFYYPDDYGPYLGTQVPQSKQNTSIMQQLKSFAKWLFRTNSMKLPSLPPGRMLEIGCASGAFLHQMSGQGWQVQGIEFSEKAAQATAQLGYNVHVGPLETAPNPDDLFDLIVGWMVLEHLHDPLACLKKLSEWAKPGALLALSVPNAGSLEFQLFKEKWYALQLPTHIHHFTPATLEKMLLASGWMVESVHHQRVLSNLIASTGYVLHDKGYAKLGGMFINFAGRAGVWSCALYPFAWLLSLFGQTGRMTVWARVK
ncbi:MAG: class I SAM-dependent methyltransferase [Methyloprofundus sp.]|nr:class I SAM-dependent methyltransferase [Methyloprofundus sp.]